MAVRHHSADRYGAVTLPLIKRRHWQLLWGSASLFSSHWGGSWRGATQPGPLVLIPPKRWEKKAQSDPLPLRGWQSHMKWWLSLGVRDVSVGQPPSIKIHHTFQTGDKLQSPPVTWRSVWLLFCDLAREARERRRETVVVCVFAHPQDRHPLPGRRWAASLAGSHQHPDSDWWELES